MASLAIVHSFCSVLPSRSLKNQTLTLTTHSRFLSSASFLKLNQQSLLLPKFRLLKPTPRNSRCAPVVFAAQFDFFKVIQTAWKVGKDGVEAGTNLVPDSVPRPIARISVTVVALAISLFMLKSFLSTAFFALATMGFVYFIFIALNKDKGPRGGGDSDSSEDPLEEARRIMDKYK
ncbi:hypothetical protein P3X46_011845 [Hevea brasiliensis]|uniref:Transmembrane protein n=1 Tax=Hevea brasiliensis TaxID=3981 RepID=A0ABQ9M8D3_HEVBR|nr:uncharacterized protein LOC110663011 [Hevea brasiliensis]KAJ9176542.1 hypothetical protein P3X46_011845 [Hevea brasiliensis]